MANVSLSTDSVGVAMTIMGSILVAIGYVGNIIPLIATGGLLLAVVVLVVIASIFG